MNSLLNQLRLVISKYEEIEKTNGTNFNIFSILNMERKEVKTHSNFIYELLNKNGSHGKGSLFLELFLTEVLEIEDYGSIEEINTIQEDLTEENRRIDFTIEISNYQIGIEMKIDAKDQKYQMYDYYQELSGRLKNQKVKLYYLTLDGKEPSDSSLIKDDQNKLDKHQYELISFTNHIIQWIEKCIKECATSTIIREALVQYLNLIKLITNQSNSKGEIMEMVNILSSENNLEIFLKAEEALSETKIKLQLSFWNNLKKELDKSKFKFDFESNNEEKEKNIEEAVKNYYEENRNNKDYGFTHYLDENKDIYYCIWINDYIFYEIGSLKNNSKFNNITNKLKIVGYDDNTYSNNYKEMLNFNNLLDTPNIFKLFEVDNLNRVTKNIEKEINDTIENMNSAIN